MRAVDQPDRNRQRRSDQRERGKRRQGQGADRAGSEGDQAPPPAPRQYDPLDERGETLGAGHHARIGKAQMKRLSWTVESPSSTIARSPATFDSTQDRG